MDRYVSKKAMRVDGQEKTKIVEKDEPSGGWLFGRQRQNDKNSDS